MVQPPAPPARLIGGRTRRPLSHTERRPPPCRARASSTGTPDTGRARLSYRRAEELFQAASGRWTLHQLRHSALTYIGEQNISAALLIGRSRRASLRSLQRDVHRARTRSTRSPPTDPERRRR